MVLAHFGEPRAVACAPGGRHCDEVLVLDRIAWADGIPSRPPTAIRGMEPGTDMVRSGREVRAIAEATHVGLQVVSVTGVPSADLVVVEPAAAGVRAPSGFAWLVRAIVTPRPGDGASAARTWLVVDDGTGEVVAAPGAVTGRSGTPGTGTSVP